MKKSISILLVLCLLCGLCGCRAEDDSAHDVYTLVTDQAGREVVLSSKPEKLVSAYYISTSALMALGVKDQLVGIEAKADKRPIYRLSAPELMELPNVGTAKDFDLEGCAALKPDLVVLPQKLQSASEKLEELGITTLIVNPETQESLENMIDLLAQVTGNEERGEELLGFIREQKEKLASYDGDRPKVYLGGNASFLSTAGKNMYQSEMLELAGAINAAEKMKDKDWVQIDYEQILTWNPDAIVLASDASYTVDDVLNDPNLQTLEAVQQGRVYAMPSDVEAWDSPVPAGILGSVWVAGVLHGDDPEWADPYPMIEEYYKEFYGFVYEKE